MMRFKRASNAAAYHGALAARFKEKIQDSLSTARRSGLLFSNVSGLAVYLAKEVGQSAGNLRRNITYRSLLEDFLAGQLGAVEIVSDATANDPVVLRAKLYKQRLESANLRNCVSRLERLIEKTSGTFPTPNELQTSASQKQIGQSGIDYRMAFECTAAVLQEVLRRADFITVDADRRLILDESARPSEQEVAGPSRARWFVMWLTGALREG